MSNIKVVENQNKDIFENQVNWLIQKKYTLLSVSCSDLYRAILIERLR